MISVSHHNHTKNSFFVKYQNNNNNMKHVLKTLIFLLICFPTWSMEIWKVAAYNWPPYSSQYMENGGIAIHHLRKILKFNDITLEEEFYPWPQVINIANSTEYIGYFPTYKNQITGNFISSLPVYQASQVIMSTNNNHIFFFTISGLFEKYKVGVQEPFMFSTKINNLIDKYPLTVFRNTSIDDLIFDLEYGYYDAIIGDPHSVNIIANEYKFSNLVKVFQFNNKKLVIALRNDAENQEKIKRLQKILKQLNLIYPY